MTIASAEVILDSISTAGKRITTQRVVQWLPIHNEYLRHRDLSSCVASSRATPVSKMISVIRDSPMMPVWWGINEPGMQSSAELEGADLAMAKQIWLDARDDIVEYAERLARLRLTADGKTLGLHKQVVNRLFSAWSPVIVLVTATEWDNFYALRCHPAAQPEMRQLAEAMLEAANASTPQTLFPGQWHIPYLTAVDRGLPTDTQLAISAARCARTSIFNHDGTSPSVEKDLELCGKLRDASPPHASPFEHQAVAMEDPRARDRNFVGWKQRRTLLQGETTRDFPRYLKKTPQVPS